MAPSLDAPEDGAGLSPVLQHPSMLVHPPIVFLGYSAWAIPFSLVVAALVRGDSTVDWIRLARPWSLLAWTVLGSGILIGAHWAYGELGWGGYWSWDPVENGSLIPWLVGTTAIHAQMTWRRRGMLKKSAMATTIATFAACNFATFLTRSGIFSSVHAFSQSPIGWLFLGLMAVIAVGGTWLIVVRRDRLQAERSVPSPFTREAMVIATTAALLVLALVVGTGTLSPVICDALISRKIVVGMSFYNRALIISGLLVLLLMAAAPLMNWGRRPSRQQTLLLISAAGAGVAAAWWAGWGEWPLVCQAVNGLAVFAIAALAAALGLDVRRLTQRLSVSRSSGSLAGRRGTLTAAPTLRRRYAGFVIHLGVASLAVGVAASSLNTTRSDVTMRPGQSLDWGGRQVKFIELAESRLPDKLVVEARLELCDESGRRDATLAPAQHFYVRQQEWTNEVDYEATWRGDFYAILHGAEPDDAVRLTFVTNPMMRWIWLGGWIMAGGTIAAIWPDRRLRARLRSRTPTPLPAWQSTRSGDVRTSHRSSAQRPAA
jgi:cytochrome c-type biogenesis protein CcmF